MDFENRVRKLVVDQMNRIMQDRGWNKKQFAEAMEVTPSTIYSFFDGKKSKTLNLFTICHICEKLRWPYTKFLSEEDMLVIPDPDLPEVDGRAANTRNSLYRYYIDSWFRLSKDQQDVVIHLLSNYTGAPSPKE